MGALDLESCYRAVKSRDRRFDGVFYTAVRTTGIYCRPSCPARTPGVRATSASTPARPPPRRPGSARASGACPTPRPGSPEWDVAATVAGRAMRLIADGVVDREGVEGLARRVGYTPRHLTRLLTAELGAGPLALARAQRAQTARVLIETHRPDATPTSPSPPASPACGSSTTPSARCTPPPRPSCAGRRGGGDPAHPRRGRAMRLAVRTPFAGRALLDFLAYHLVPGVEVAGDGWYARTLDLPHGPGTVRLDMADVLGAGPDGLRHGDLHAGRPARHRRRGRAGTPAARRRLRPAGRRRPLRR